MPNNRDSGTYSSIFGYRIHHWKKPGNVWFMPNSGKKSLLFVHTYLRGLIGNLYSWPVNCIHCNQDRPESRVTCMLINGGPRRNLSFIRITQSTQSSDSPHTICQKSHKGRNRNLPPAMLCFNYSHSLDERSTGVWNRGVSGEFLQKRMVKFPLSV